MQFTWKNMVGVALPYRLSMNSQRCHAVPSNKTRQSFLHPPSRHQQRTMMVTSISSKYFCNTARQKRQPSQAVCMGSPPATSLIWGRWSLDHGYSDDSIKGKILLEKRLKYEWLEVPLCYRRTCGLESVARVSPTPVTVA